VRNWLHDTFPSLGTSTVRRDFRTIEEVMGINERRNASVTNRNVISVNKINRNDRGEGIFGKNPRVSYKDEKTAKKIILLYALFNVIKIIIPGSS
jgi:hypothetical protein